jgi:hypothetical protein
MIWRRNLMGMLVACGLLSAAISAAQQNLPPTPVPPRGLPASSPDDVLRATTERNRLAAAQFESANHPLQAVPPTGSVMPSAPVGAAGDTAGLSSYHRALNAYYRKLEADYQYTTTAFRWHQVSSLVILLVVLVVVALGLYFSWVQFRRDLEAERKTAPPKRASTAGQAPAESQAPSEPNPPTSQVKLGPQGIEVNSSVLGVVILVISLAFLYLYLAYVYPITIAK